ncbi:MAG: cupin domain-containing protein [Olsenella sp.]|jgi:predicted cupin superfamily sugar epimerase
MTRSGLSAFANGVIDSLGLSPHPEGGWYRRTWQSEAAIGENAPDTDMGENSTGARPLASLIYFLLPAGDASDWHVVDADELWLWHGPGAVTLELGGSGERPDEAHATRTVLLVNNGASCGQLIVPAGVWQRTIPTSEDALVSCVVSPGFVYSGFALAEK